MTSTSLPQTDAASSESMDIDTDAAKKPLTLVTCDNERISCDVTDTEHWSTLKDLIEDCASNSAGIPEIPLMNENCTGAAMRKVLEFTKYYKGPGAEQNAKLAKDPKQDLPAWDAAFYEMPAGALTKTEDLKPELIFPVVMAANFLGYEHLLDSSTKAIAMMIKGRTAEQIRKLFNIVNDFTPEEEDNLKLENEWCEESLDAE